MKHHELLGAKFEAGWLIVPDDPQAADALHKQLETVMNRLRLPGKAAVDSKGRLVTAKRALAVIR